MATTIDVSALDDKINEHFGLLFANSYEHSDTLEAGNIGALEVVTGLKGDNLNLHRGSISANFIDTTCSPTDSTTDTYTDVSVPLRDLMFFKEWCIREIENKPLNAYLSAGQEYDGLEGLEALILAETSKLLGTGVEDRVWTGTNSAGSFQGLDTVIQAGIASTNAGGGAVSTGALTTANTFGFVQGLVAQAASSSNKNIARGVANGGLSIWMGHDAAYKMVREYETSVGNTGNVLYRGLAIPEMVPGTQVRVRPVSGLHGTDNMYLTWDTNFALGTDLLSDASGFSVGMDQYEEKIWIKAPFKMGAGVAVIADVLAHDAA